MLRYILFGLISIVIWVSGEKDADTRKLHLEGLGTVIGEKFWDGEYYEFLGIPYATAPKGRDRYKAPLPPTPWEKDLEAKGGLIICQQVYHSDQEEEEDLLYGTDECLVSSFFMPKLASEKNLVPIVVYIHSGGFCGGSGNMAKFHQLARHDILVVNFNYRVGAIGFACLGTEDIPGNAALKDIVAALKFIKKYAKTFGGDPDDITIAGYSVGSTLAEIVALSGEAKGLFNKLILDSGSALTPYAINRHPIETAKNIVKGIGYKDTGYLDDLNEFLLEADTRDLLDRSRNFFLKNSTFGFAPCIENPSNPGAVLVESPIEILKKGKYGDFALMIGFGNMEGISRTSKFNDWRGLMNQKFQDFLPADLVFDNEKERDQFIEEVKKYYFDSKTITLDSAQGYIDYFSDSMFKYGFMKSAKMHAENLKRPIFLYEFTYVGKLNTKHEYMDRIRGASHRDASAYVLDFYDWTRNYTDMDRRDLMTAMWADFVKAENPTIYETSLLKTKWLPYTNKDPKYLDIGDQLVMKKDLFSKGYQFWDKVYKKHYWNPTAVNPDAYKRRPKSAKTDNEKVVPESSDKTTTKTDSKPVAVNADSSPPSPNSETKPNPEAKAGGSKIETKQKSEETKTNAKEKTASTDPKKSGQKPVTAKPADEKPSEATKSGQKPVDTKPIIKNPGTPTASTTKQGNKEEVKK